MCNIKKVNFKCKIEENFYAYGCGCSLHLEKGNEERREEKKKKGWDFHCLTGKKEGK